jgi:hypothetical protein
MIQITMEKKKLTIEAFQHELGDKFDQWKGNWKEEKFDALLKKYNFEEDEADRESLRIELKNLGFFKGGSKGNAHLSPSEFYFLITV